MSVGFLCYFRYRMSVFFHLHRFRAQIVIMLHCQQFVPDSLRLPSSRHAVVCVSSGCVLLCRMRSRCLRLCNRLCTTWTDGTDWSLRSSSPVPQNFHKDLNICSSLPNCILSRCLCLCVCAWVPCDVIDKNRFFSKHHQQSCFFYWPHIVFSVR